MELPTIFTYTDKLKLICSIEINAAHFIMHFNGKNSVQNNEKFSYWHTGFCSTHVIPSIFVSKFFFLENIALFQQLVKNTFLIAPNYSYFYTFCFHWRFSLGSLDWLQTSLLFLNFKWHHKTVRFLASVRYSWFNHYLITVIFGMSAVHCVI